MTISGLVSDAQYCVKDAVVLFKLYMSFTLGGTASSTLTVSLPYALNGQQAVACAAIGQPAWSSSFAYLASGTSNLVISPNAGANYALAATAVMAQGFYRLY
jgi:hypothetical protein